MHQTIIKEYNIFSPHEILPLYESVGWVNYTKHPEMLAAAYQNSLKCYAAYLDEQLVGMIRVVGDGVSVVFVQDLLVHPSVQRQGIGTALLHKILEEYRGVYQLHLLTDDTEQTTAFYRSLGFYTDAETGCRAFSRFHQD